MTKFTGLWRTHYRLFLDTISSHNLLLIGRTGKTTALKAIQSKHQAIYIPLKHLGRSPEHFCLDLLSTTLSQTLTKPYSALRGITALRQHAPETIQEALHTIDNELQKIKPNYTLLVTTALTLPHLLGHSLVLIDDAHLLAELKNYKINPYQFPQTTRWVLATNKTLPVSFRTYTLEPFSLDEMRTHLKAYNLAESTLSQLHSYSEGLPHIAQSIATTYDHKRNVKRHYTHQLLTDSVIQRHAQAQLTHQLHEARGASLLAVVLRVIAEHGPGTLSEIARKTYRPAPVTKSILLRLLEADLIQQDGRQFSLRSTIIRDYTLLDVLGMLEQHVTPALLNEAEGRL